MNCTRRIEKKRYNPTKTILRAKELPILLNLNKPSIKFRKDIHSAYDRAAESLPAAVESLPA